MNIEHDGLTYQIELDASPNGRLMIIIRDVKKSFARYCWADEVKTDPHFNVFPPYIMECAIKLAKNKAFFSSFPSANIASPKHKRRAIFERKTK